MLEFDENDWRELIKRPGWYLEYAGLAAAAKEQLGQDSAELQRLNKQIRHFFEEALAQGQVALAEAGPDEDSERQPIDTVVIHHTSAKPGYQLDYMDATQLLNIYARHYAEDADKKGEPIWSGHFSSGRQVFWCYHWLMRMDGGFERLLDDNQIGWHAGNWDVNTRSIAICLDNDYENQDPSDETLQKLAAFIKENYPDKKIIGHCEARSDTICPGKNFLDGWKADLLSYLK
jgi:N-acetyl-anhydromuramyl-L-alanine amidase AmpD